MLLDTLVMKLECVRLSGLFIDFLVVYAKMHSMKATRTGVISK